MKCLNMLKLLALLGLASCAPGVEDEIPAETTSESNQSALLKLYVFDCGRFLLNDEQFDAFDYGITSADTDVRETICPCYVIEHEKGRLLWDGGLVSATADVEGWQDGGGWLMRLDRTLGEQLAIIGLDYSSFDYMAFSHMHLDHVGVANEIEGAKLLIQRAEYDAAFAEEVNIFGFIPALYEGLRDSDLQILEGEYDVFGDGRVRIIPAPGHTPGHQILFVDLEKTGPVILSGDLYHYQISRQKRAVPGYNVDPEATLASMSRVDGILEETGATLWIQHEVAQFQRVAQAPKYNE